MPDVPNCPLCDWQWPPELAHRIYNPSRDFLLAEHLMTAHMAGWEDVLRREVRCFCGTPMTEHVWVVMAHFQQYGGVEEHYRAWQLGVDP